MNQKDLKTIVILCDGMSDYTDSKGQTPMSLAHKPNMDNLAKSSLVGLCQSVPKGQKPGSDTANLAVLGYDPFKFYTGRSPIEALSMGINLNDEDVSYRCNLVTLKPNGESFEDWLMNDYSAGEISNAEGAQLINALKDNICGMEFYAGVSYRNIALKRLAKTGAQLTPPHDILDKPIRNYLPKGEYSIEFNNLIKKSYEIFNNHPVNIERIKQGKNPANAAWFWGEGRPLSLPSFKQKFNKSGAVISAVDLIKGIGIAAGMDVLNIEGATGNLHTNFDGKTQAAINAVKKYDFVFVHIEAPDECAHQGDKNGKIKSIELIDSKILEPLLKNLKQNYKNYRILILPDHATPCALRTHTDDPVPFLLYDSLKPYEGSLNFSESSAKNSGVFWDNANFLMQNLFF